MKKTLIILFTSFIIIAGLLASINLIAKNDKAHKNEKNITIDVIHKDGSLTIFYVETKETLLDKALLKEKLIKGKNGQYGLFVTCVDDEYVDEAKQEWWCITKNEKEVNTSISNIKIKDNEKYEFTFKTGY